jgi:hypothetical protein
MALLYSRVRLPHQLDYMHVSAADTSASMT